MEDSYFFGSLIYLVLVISVMGFMPDTFFVSDAAAPDPSDLEGVVPDNPINPIDNLTFFQKIISFMIFTITIDGLPVYFSIVLTLFNIGSVSIAAVWVYDKFRGIGS